jgi:hypothetical protein
MMNELYRILLEGIPTLYGYRYARQNNTRIFERYAHEDSAAFELSLLGLALSKGSVLAMRMEHRGEDTAVKPETIYVKVIEITETQTKRVNAPILSTQKITFIEAIPPAEQAEPSAVSIIKAFTKLMAVSA